VSLPSRKVGPIDGLRLAKGPHKIINGILERHKKDAEDLFHLSE
jgi:hypothetical protein